LASRPQLMARLRGSYRYEEVAEEFGIPPGLAYMIVTGLPADGSDVLSPGELEGREGLLEGPTQPLVNPPTEVPEHKSTVEEWMRRRVAADAAMRRAGEERTAIPPPMEAEDETDEVVSVIGWQHNQVKYLQEQLETIPGVRKGGDEAKQQQRVSIVDMIRMRLSRHETAEEEHFWPAVRRHLEGGDELAEKALAQEQEGKDILQALTGVSGGEDRFDELVEELVGALRKHVAHEDYVLLRFEQEVPEDVRSELGQKFRQAYGHAPTRPHPHAPNEGAPLKAAAKLAAPLDHMRDALGDRPAEREGRAEERPANEVTRQAKKQNRTKKGAE
jgi:hemerythrin-like domain-containing protein